ncbi:MAG: hypothetical protein A2Y17_13520 [Clostridiales bacterium GWF2_38_85]|nr:MAG: hypothetical protein A2Y17_13520 [Clostridiales bacterium GWF2_38_85]
MINNFMPQQKIKSHIIDALTGDAQKNALEFFEYLTANEMLFEKGKGYWEDKHYWMIKYKDKYVCFILINGSEDKIGDKTEPDGWIIWSDDSDSDWFADFPLDNHLKKIAWENVDVCANCGSCSGGKNKTIFGKKFDNVCRTTFRFNNPSSPAMECLQKMVEIRKHDIFATAVERTD